MVAGFDKLLARGPYYTLSCGLEVEQKFAVAPLLNLLRFQLDGLAIDEDTLPLVWLRFPPHPDLGRKLHNHLFLNSFEKYSCRLRCTSLHPLGYSELDRVRVAHFERDELLAGILWLFRDCGVFNRCSVSNSDQSQNGGVSL